MDKNTEYIKRYAALLSYGGGGEHSEYVRKRLDAEAERYALQLAELTDMSCPERADVLNGAFTALAALAAAYKCETSVYFGDKALKQKILSSLERLHKTYCSDITPVGNWWYWEIGVPMSINKLCCLMHGELDPELMHGLLEAERCFNDKIKMTGANKVWEAFIFAVRGLLLDDEREIAEASRALDGIFDSVKTGDGFYDDGSFIQHGNIPYNGGYGRSLMYELASYCYIFDNAKLAKTAVERFKTSVIPFIAYGDLMGMVRGREVSRYYEQCGFGGARMLGAALGLLETSYDEELERLVSNEIGDEFFEHCTGFEAELADKLLLKNISYGARPFFKAFNAMDRAVKRGDGFTAGLAMYSERIANYESINGENMNGGHTSDGMLYIYREGEHKSNLFWRTIDKERLPGTTVQRGSEMHANRVSTSAFAGGCQIDSDGVCAMELAPPESTLKAAKAWFFFGNEIIALGSGITSRDGLRVETTIENRLVSGNSRFTVYGQQTDNGSYKIKGAYLDGDHDIAYIFPELQQVRILREERGGVWDNVRTERNSERDMYVTMWIDHGKNPRDASYEYILLPKCSRERYEKLIRSNDINIVENSPWIQCVKRAGVTGIVFRKERTRSIEGVLCDKRCIVMLKQSKNSLTVAVTEPEQKQKSLYIELDREADNVVCCDKEIKVTQLKPYVRLEINTESLAGRTVSVTLGGCGGFEKCGKTHGCGGFESFEEKRITENGEE